MNQEMLLSSARKLIQPNATAADEFEQKQIELGEKHNQRMGARPDLERLIGTDNLAMMEDNTRNFCRFMGTMFHTYEPTVLVETVLWVFRAYRSHGFNTTFWPAHIDTFIESTRFELTPATFDAVYPFFEWLIVNIPAFVAITDGQMALDPLQDIPSHD